MDVVCCGCGFFGYQGLGIHNFIFKGFENITYGSLTLFFNDWFYVWKKNTLADFDNGYIE
jgi:hypothetical protein